MGASEYLLVEEVAAAAKVHKDTVRRWLREGSLHGARVRGQWRVKREDFERFMSGQASAGPPS